MASTRQSRLSRHVPSRRSAAAAVVGLVMAMAVGAAELEFSAAVDRTTVGLGEQLTLTVTVTGTNLGRVPRPKLPELPGFDNLGSTSSQSTSIQFVNGRMTQQQTISYVYFLAPKEIGEAVIGPASLEAGGETYATQPITITVAKEAQAPAGRPAPRQQQAPRGFPDPWDDWDPFGMTRPRQPQAQAGRNVHLISGADRTSVYVGEQVTVNYTFYTRLQIANLQLADLPTYSGFWAQTLYEARELEYRRRELDGQQYSAAPLRRVALFPTRAGELTVGTMKVAGAVARSFFSTEPFEVASSPIPIRVKPLPDSGRPASFTGGVGSFELEASLDRDSSQGGEPLNLVVKVSGSGNIQLVGAPTAPQISGVKVLSPETDDRVSTASGKVTGAREFKFPLIPQADGRFVVPPFEVGFFDPKAGSYYTRSTAALEFYASGATGQMAAVETETGLRVLGSDIVHIKPSIGPIITPGGWRGLPWWGLLFYPAGIVVLAVGILAGRHRRRLEHDRGYARLRRSSRMVRRRLAEAGRLLDGGREAEFYSALDRAVLGYVGDRFNIEAQGLTGEQLRSELARCGVAGETTAMLFDLIKLCDVARFSSGMADCSPRETYDRARRVLEGLQ